MPKLNSRMAPATVAQLQQACTDGTLRLFQTWKSLGCLPDLKAAYNTWSPLTSLIIHGHLECLKWMLQESGCEFRFGNNGFDNSALQLTAIYGQFEMLKWLVSESAQPVDVTFNNNILLSHAVLNRHFEIVEWLILDSEQAARRNPAWAGRDVPKISLAEAAGPLMVDAARVGSLEMVRWILEMAPAAIDPAMHGFLAFSEAVTRNNMPLAKYFLFHAPFGKHVFESVSVLEIDESNSVLMLKFLTNYFYGLQTPPRLPKGPLLAYLQQQTPQVGVYHVMHALDRLGVDDTLASRQPYLCSAPCRKLAEAGLAHRLEDFDRINGTTPQKPRRL